MSLFKEIFSEQDNLSQQEIKNYLFNNSESESYDIEKKSLANDLNSDALEGFANNKSSLLKLDSLKKTAFKSIFKNNYIALTSFSLSIIIILTIYFYSYKQNNTSPSTVDLHKITTNNKTKTSSAANIGSIKDNLEKVNNSISKINKDPKKIIRQNNYVPLILDKRESKLEINNNNIEPKQIKNYINFGTKYIADLKIVDYSKTKRQNNLNKTSVDIWNVEPRFSNNQEQFANNNSTIKSIEYSYFEFLEEGLSLFNKKDYFSAIENFEIILQQYDNDLNATFYSGLSYYYIGDYKKAIKYFNKVISSNINVFYEEGLWYKALSYNKSNPKESVKILNQIVKENGFYSKKATQKLKNK